MSPLSLIKTTLLGIALTLLAPLAANATNEAWDSSSSGPIGQGWALSNGNLTATSPNTGPTQSTTANGNINGQFASQSIPTGQKSYFEITVNTASAPGTGSNTKWYYLQTAFCVGVGEHGLSYGTINGNDIGAIINPATYIQYGYNRGVSNSGYVIYAPEAGEVAPGSPINAPPSAWVPGDVIGIAVDRQDNPATVTFYHNGVSDGGAFNISGIPTNSNIYPCLQSWWLEGPTATINGGNSSAFKYSVPSGYTALDTLNGGTPPPAAPTGLTASASGTQINLSWSASSGATSYSVYRGTTSGGESSTAIVSGLTTTSYVNTGLANSTTYYYEVKATNSGGTSGSSNEAHATTGGTAPAAPTGLTASASGTQISLSWSASSGATSYSVYRGTTSGGESTTAIASGLTTTSYINTGLANGTYYYKVTASDSSGTSGYSNEASATVSTGGGGSLPAGQTDTDIGGPSPAGTASYSGGVYTVTAGGANIYGTSDQYNYLNQSSAGDETLIARVTGLSGTNLNAYAKAGVEFRDSTADNAIDVKADYEPGTVCFTYRSATGASAVLEAYVTVGVTPSTTTPVWVKLVKSGTTYTACYSTSVGTPSSWTQVGSSSVTVSLTNNNSYLAGLCTCSHNNGTAVTATYDNVSPEQADTDIGGPSPAGTASYSGGVYTVTAGGANIYGTSDQYNYLNQTGSGDETLIARVTGLSGTNLNEYAKAGVEFRDSTADNAIDVKADYEPGTVCFTYRSATGASAVLEAYVTVSVTPSTTTPVWVKLVKSGTTYTAYYSTSVGTPSTWTQVGSSSVTVSLTNNNSYLVGLCTCSHDNGTAVTATYDNVGF